MNSSDLYARFRSDVFDVQEPYLWSDTEVYAYLDAAQKQFCRLTGGILDSSSALTQVAVMSGDPWVNIDPRILKIQKIFRASDFGPVDPVTLEDLDRLGQEADYGFQRRYRLDNMPGEVRYAITNMEANKLRLLRVPVAADTLQLTVYRLPLKTINDADQKLEIAEQHHEFLLLGMKARAYRKQDAETRDDRKAGAFEGEFRLYCDQARQERERREHKPRTIGYGGI